MLDFDPVLLTGDDEIDRQHRELFARVGALLDAGRLHESRAEVTRLLDFMGAYVVEHFAAEERRMIETAYPRLEAHRREHERLAADLAGLRRELDETGASPLLVIRAGTRLTSWLREHVYRTDRLLGAWLGERRP
jgi:hemerythrin